MTMNFRELVLETRSCRRYDESVAIDRKVLEDLVDLARLSPSGSNRQPLKYLLLSTPDECRRIFPSLAWAAYLKDWGGPAEGERPTGYIVILGDKLAAESFGVDHGIAARTILLGAMEAGLSGCIIASVNHSQLRNGFSIPEQYEILLVLALGKKAEKIVIDGVKDDDIRYWRDEEGIHHVPKRALDDIILTI